MSEGVPEELRRRIAEDLQPVEPLGPPWKRVAWIAPLLAVILVLPFVLRGFRLDLGELGMALAWVPLGLQILLGFALLTLALRQTAPGWLTPRYLLLGFLFFVLAVHLGINLLIYLRHPRPPPGDFLAAWWDCYGNESMIGLPILLINAWLAVKALPLRPKLAGFLGGTAAGLLAEASWRLVCPVSDPSHVVLAHGGGILGLGLVGVVLGWLWERLD